MTTAQAIEAITDAGDFEILATGVLRLVDQDCYCLQHLGVNAAGKPVPGPLDAFCRVPGTEPARFVMAAFTTTSAADLTRKWLDDRSAPSSSVTRTAADDSDLVKAFLQAEQLRQDYPDATFVVHLCTNRQPGQNLIEEVMRYGEQRGLEVRLLTRSRLRDFLDTDPTGQWLRKEHLGIEAERLSLPLLRELSRKSLKNYAAEFLITPTEAFVATSAGRALVTSIVPARSVHIVMGPSGMGKSVACYQVLQDHLDAGGIGLRIRGEIVALADSLEHAIDLTLRSLHPGVEQCAGAEAIRLGSHSKRFLIIADDINRSNDPVGALRKLRSWGRPRAGGNSAPSFPYAILVPAWDQFWAPLHQEMNPPSWLGEVPVTRMEDDEALACLDGSLGSDVEEYAEAERRSIVSALGRDPILIAMYADTLAVTGGSRPPALAHEVIGRFVDASLGEAAPSGTSLPADYRLALSHLATRILEERDLYPRWADIQQWLTTDETKAIRGLARSEKLCRVTGRDGDDRFEFRHDRILEHFLALAFQQMLSESDANADVIADPFYASFVGRALASAEATDDQLAFVRQRAPLALIASLRHIPAMPADSSERFATAAKAWLEAASNDPNTPPVLLFEAYRLLQETDTPEVLNVTQSLPYNPLLARARLANGDASGVITEFSRRHWFAPSLNDSALDAAFDRGLHRYRTELVTQCAAMLGKPDLAEPERHGALVLAGFIGDDELADAVSTAWELAADKTEVLLPALWAGFRCAATDTAGLLGPMMAVWAALPDDRTGGGLSMRGSMAEELKFAVRRGISGSILSYLIAAARANSALRWPITVTLEHYDAPHVVCFLVEEAAHLEQRIKETGGFSPWVFHLRRLWDPIEPYGKRLPTESVEVVRACWDDDTNEAQVRETAFHLWVRAIDDVEALRSIPSAHPHFDSVLWRRAELGDVTVVPWVKPKIATNGRWFDVLAGIWSEQFDKVVDAALQNLKDKTPTDYTGGESDAHFALAHLLRDIPASDAQPLLMKHWDRLKFSPLFVQAALYIGSPESLELATEAIRGYPPNVDPFNYIGWFFGFLITGLTDRLERRHLEALEGYVDMLGDHDIEDIAEFCERHDLRQWSLIHLKPEFDRRRAQEPQSGREEWSYLERSGRRHFPSNVDLLDDLDWIELQEQHSRGHLHVWLEVSARRRDDRADVIRILDTWLSCSPSVGRSRLVADALCEIGTRSDIDLLTKHMIPGDAAVLERLQMNARFAIRRRSLQ